MPEETSSRNQMALCAVLQITHSMPKNADANTMEVCVWCMRLGLLIAVGVR